MKLLKKLLPLAIVGTTAAAITPFVASCGNKDEQSASWNYRDGIFVYTTDKHAKTSYSVKDATKAYFEAVEDDHLILAEDIVQKMSYYQRMGQYDRYIPMIPLSAKSIVKEATYDSSIGTNGACFLTFTLDFAGIMGTEIDTDEIIFDTYGEGTLEVQNVAFGLTYRPTPISQPYENHWDMDPVLVGQEDWKVTVDVALPELGRTEHMVFTSDDAAVWQVLGLAFANAASPDYCYYLNDVTLGS